MKNKFNILDCTLRDGGYYNNWNFSNDIVNDYLKTMSVVGVDFVELGFRSFQTKNFKGPTWYTTESYLNSLSIPKNLTLGVMVNASELILHPSGFSNATKLMFTDAKKSKVKLIRLACHFEEFSETAKICKILQKMGYLVGINLMQISEQTEEKITSVELGITGIIDQLFKVGKNLIPLDFKTHTNRFAAFIWNKAHREQLILYSLLSEIDNPGYKANSAILELTEDLTRTKFKITKKDKKDAIDHIKQARSLLKIGQVPPKLSGPDAIKCSKCYLKDHCFSFEEEVEA